MIEEEVADGRELLLVYGQSGDHALAASDPVVLHLSSWRDVRDQTLAELVEILAENRLAQTEIADLATVETGVGEAQRLHRWWAIFTRIGASLHPLE